MALEIVAAEVRNRLEADGDRCLIIFDNVTDPDELQPYLPAAGRSQVVITITHPPRLPQPLQLPRPMQTLRPSQQPHPSHPPYPLHPPHPPQPEQTHQWPEASRPHPR